MRIPRFFWYPEWVVTSASDETKLSLHLVNRSVIFMNMDLFKQFYNEFGAYYNAFIESTHPFYNAFDRCVASNNRGMRMTYSTKLGKDRMLIPLKSFCPLDWFKMENSLITNTQNDTKKIDKKIGPQAASLLFGVRKYTDEESTSPKESDKINPYVTRQFEYPDVSKPEHLEQVRALLRLLKDERAENYEEWRDVGFILHHHKIPYELFDEFSKRIPSKYTANGCRQFWDSISTSVERPLTLGTLHFHAKQDSPKEYAAFCHRYQEISIDLSFSHFSPTG
jgi:RNAse (barnase) inhibitor barstar